MRDPDLERRRGAQPDQDEPTRADRPAPGGRALPATTAGFVDLGAGERGAGAPALRGDDDGDAGVGAGFGSPIGGGARERGGRAGEAGSARAARARGSGRIVDQVIEISDDPAAGQPEADRALRLLGQLGRRALAGAVDEIGPERIRVLFGLISYRARQTRAYARTIAALGPEGMLPYVREHLSYGLLDWVISDGEALAAAGVLKRLRGDARRELFDQLGPEMQRRLFDSLPDSAITMLKLVIGLRFGVTFQRSRTPGERGAAWEASGLRRLWTVLEALPPAHVRGNDALDFIERLDGKPDEAGGFYWERSPGGGGRDEIAISYDEDRLDAEVGDTFALDSDPLGQVNAFDATARHEVGHAVDAAGDFSLSYCEGNEAGGDWV